jgi:hypothetical protein
MRRLLLLLAFGALAIAATAEPPNWIAQIGL